MIKREQNNNRNDQTVGVNQSGYLNSNGNGNLYDNAQTLSAIKETSNYDAINANNRHNWNNQNVYVQPPTRGKS